MWLGLRTDRLQAHLVRQHLPVDAEAPVAVKVLLIGGLNCAAPCDPLLLLSEWSCIGPCGTKSLTLVLHASYDIRAQILLRFPWELPLYFP